MFENPVTSKQLAKYRIKVKEPFAEFLQAGDEEINFEISLLDVVQFAGHACPAMVGAFLMTKVVVDELFDGGTCVRGDLKIDIRFGPSQGATGPIANVFSFITGAWSETGFGGLQGKFSRRHLLKFSSGLAKPNSYKFTRITTGKSVDVYYDPSRIQVEARAGEAFQALWRNRISALLAEPEKYILCEQSVDICNAQEPS